MECHWHLMTGKYKSVPVEDLVLEANYLAKQGVRELLLIAQDLSYYGKDIYGMKKLTEIDFINGAVVTLGRKNGIETPFNSCICSFLKFLEKKRLLSQRTPEC